jgi:hypothetical protein
VTVHSLPFATAFNPGHGPSYRQNGAVSYSKDWFHLSVQDAQPRWLQRGGDFVASSGARVARSAYGCTVATGPRAWEGSQSYRCEARVPPGCTWQVRGSCVSAASQRARASHELLRRRRLLLLRPLTSACQCTPWANVRVFRIAGTL